MRLLDTWSSVIFCANDTRCADFANRGGAAGYVTVSFVADELRSASTPIVATPSTDWKRRLESGIRISANQPESVRAVATSQIVFQS